MIISDHCSEKPSQLWSLVGQQIKWMIDTQETQVVGVKRMAVSTRGCNLFTGPPDSLINIEWVKEFVDFNGLAKFHYF